MLNIKIKSIKNIQNQGLYRVGKKDFAQNENVGQQDRGHIIDSVKLYIISWLVMGKHHGIMRLSEAAQVMMQQ